MKKFPNVNGAGKICEHRCGTDWGRGLIPLRGSNFPFRHSFQTGSGTNPPPIQWASDAILLLVHSCTVKKLKKKRSRTDCSFIFLSVTESVNNVNL